MMKESKEHESKALQRDYREYRCSRAVIFSHLVIALCFFIFAFILGILQKEFGFKIPGIFLFLTGLYFIVMFIHLANTTALTTTEDEIIISDKPFLKHRHIMVKDIIEVRNQMDSLIQPGVLIWYNYQDEIRKVRIAAHFLRKEDQKGFLDYVRNIIKKSGSV